MRLKGTASAQPRLRPRSLFVTVVGPSWPYRSLRRTGSPCPSPCIGRTRPLRQARIPAANYAGSFAIFTTSLRVTRRSRSVYRSYRSLLLVVAVRTDRSNSGTLSKGREIVRGLCLHPRLYGAVRAPSTRRLLKLSPRPTTSTAANCGAWRSNAQISAGRTRRATSRDSRTADRKKLIHAVEHGR